MPSGQVSVRVPIVVGIIGLVGVVAGRAKDTFLGEVRAELGVDTPADHPGPSGPQR
ncbi:hypothetical protein [Amycolatopsis sp. DG1A-15b]|uniref:hypothetical protein n=1 Tax=Amycolatopsis sp. DG1A-15b TaxID=3052846 RepID=UPI00255BF43E|nr:hypothetical protein [Amycolatopsis sp. DG1A-15b]WIX90198.1 hypothetical protein QRY02_07065 [Amycolatopsis sp. DG1A-15b]